MAEAVVENRTLPVRFFCHKCSIELEYVSQDYTCPICFGGFIEQLEDTDATRESSAARTNNAPPNRGLGFEDPLLSGLDFPDDEFLEQDNPPGQDLSFVMYNNEISPLNMNGAESRFLQMMQQLTGAVPGSTGANSPLLLVGGAPMDLLLSGEGLDSVMSQLLWQVESDGPPPLAAEAIANLPEVAVTQQQEQQSMQCSVCWEAFVKDEKVRELSCGHLYHQGCITPWLTLHATCPICRKSLAPPAARQPAATPTADLAALPGLSFLFRACGVPFPQPSTASTAAGGQAGTASVPTSTTAPSTPAAPVGLAAWSPSADTASRIRPVAGVLSLFRSISSPPTTSTNNTEQRPRPPPPPSNYDMDLEFD